MNPTIPRRLDLLDLISAIGSAEGAFTPTNLPARLRNPTDLRFAGQPGAKPAAEGTPPFAQFDSWERGVCAGLRQVLKRIAEGHTAADGKWEPMTLRILITDPQIGWAPDSDGNNSANYLAETIRRIKACSGLTVEPDEPLWSLLVIEHIA